MEGICRETKRPRIDLERNRECSRRYSFHWQYKDGSLRIRWDNAPHHKSMTNRLVVDEDMHGGRKKEVFDSSYMLKYNLEFQKVRILSVR
jgi:hypothetical protein